MPSKGLLKYPTWIKRYNKRDKWPTCINLVGVLWRDAVKAPDDGGTDEKLVSADPVLAFTCGTVVKADEKHIVVAQEVFADRTNRDRTGIPAGMIEGVIDLGHTPLFSDTE